MVDAALRKEARNAPDKPGVYLFKHPDGTVLYIGKAKSLKKRVRSYFHKNQAVEKTTRLVEQSRFLDFYVTATEVEALILECNLIKRYRPRYNIEYRDDKSYPYLALDFKEEWPRVRYTRERHRSGSRYFGPYVNAHVLKDTLDTLLKIFPLRVCSDAVFKRAERHKRPCLYYHIGRCPGPCCGFIGKEEYDRTLGRISAFLEGRQEQVIADLTEEMKQAAANTEYERAAVFRDRIRSASQTLEKQKVTTDSRVNQDIFGIAEEADLACVQLLKVRTGKLIGSEDFLIEMPAPGDEREILTGFIKQYYSGSPLFPDEIVLPRELEEQEAIAAWLSGERGRLLKLSVPKRGLKRRLIEMATENAWHSLGRSKLRTGHESKKLMAALSELQAAAGLKDPPATIECFDISNLQGGDAVGSMVVFIGGKPAKQAYRRFKIKSGLNKPNDFAMMKEVVGRRLARGFDDRKFVSRPDLIIVDGGKPQLKAAMEALKESGSDRSIGLAALAKQNEELFVPGGKAPVRLADRSPGLYLVQRIRDEAHRFALDYHRRLRAKAVKASGLDGIPGIGPKRKTMLLRRFKSLKGIRAAGEEDLVGAGLPRKIAKNLKEEL